METMEIFRAVLALVLVLGLIGAVAWAARRFGPSLWFGARPKRERILSVLESLPIDARHRLVLVRRGERKHLLLIGPNHSLVVEDGIVDRPAQPEPAP